MRAEHLRQWLIAATLDDTPDATNWLKVVAIVKADLRDGMLAEDITRKTVVLILKGEIGDFIEISPMEVPWKTVTSHQRGD